MKNKYITSYFCISLFISCAQVSKRKVLTEPDYNVGEVSDVNFEKDLAKNNSLISLQDKGPDEVSDGSYGPVIKNLEKNENTASSEKEKSFHLLYFRPNDFRTFSYVGSVKKILKEKEINPVMIGGSCFSSVISSLITKYKDYNSFEWNAYKLHNQMKGIEYNSKEYYRRLKKYISKEFAEDKIEQLQRSNFILDKDEKKVIIRESGQLSTVLNNHLQKCEESPSFFLTQNNEINERLINLLEKRNLNRLILFNINHSVSLKSSNTNPKTQYIDLDIKKSTNLKNFDYYLKKGLSKTDI